MLDSQQNKQISLTTKEIFEDLELTSTRIKKEIYHALKLVEKLDFDPIVKINVLEHLEKMYREFDTFQQFYKSRT